MTEKRFLNFILIEAMLLIVLGLAMLILPKVTTITFGVMLCLLFIIYGIYKVVKALMTRKFEKHFILDIVIGVLLTVLGIVMFSVEPLNLLVITSIIGVYFILETISSRSCAFQMRNNMHFWWVKIGIAIVEFLIGLIIILGLPNISFWLVCMLVGIDYLVVGTMLTTLYLANKCAYTM